MAEASMLEEPGAGKPHARIRAGAVGQLAVLPRCPLDYIERSNIRKEIRKMNATSFQAQDGVFKRILLLYGLYSLLSNAVYLLGYYLLPEGFMRGSPGMTPARVAATGTFWSEFALTFLINLVLVVLLSVI
jgi:hypothetical protein